MTKDQVLMYLKAIVEAFGPDDGIELDQKTWANLHTAIEEVLAQPERVASQKPVAYEPMWGGGPTNKDYEDAMRARRLSELTTPQNNPQRIWVGLTDEEILEAWCIHLDEGDEDEIEEWRHVINEAREIEAKLKEKNCG